MQYMNLRKLIDFLKALKINNDREWFQKNKTQYDLIKDEMLAFIGRLIQQISVFDPEISLVTPKECIFRIYRDVRFSKDKSPYKKHIGAFISKTGRKGNNPGYYLHFEPNNSFIAGGLYMPPPEILKAIRNEIYYNTEEFVSILSHPYFLKFFGELDDYDKLIRPPKGFSADWQHVDFVKYRSYVATHYLSEENLYSQDLESVILSVFNAIYPLNKFLNRAKENMEG